MQKPFPLQSPSSGSEETVIIRISAKELEWWEMSPLSQYVQALAGTIHVKIKNNLLQPRSFDRDEHYAQTVEQIFTLSDYIALAVIKEGITGKDKLCQSWRPALTLKRVSCLTGKGLQAQEWECYADEQISPTYHFLFWIGRKTTENLSLKFLR